jgi:DNA-binding MarR family transcriptional regulator
LYDFDSCVAVTTNRAAKKMADAFNERLLKLGISRVKWTALYYLGKNPGISQRELAMYMHIKSSTVACLIERMEKEGLVDRVKDSTDRRVSILELSGSGQKLMDKLLPEAQRFCQELSLGISERDLQIYNAVMEQLLQNIGLGK